MRLAQGILTIVDFLILCFVHLHQEAEQLGRNSLGTTTKLK